MAFTYDPKADRYRSDRGRFVSRKQAQAYIETSLEASKEKAKALATSVGAGDITAASWRNQMKAEIKAEYIRQYLLGRGGLGSMTASDWGTVGNALKGQYKYLDDFYKQVQAGELSDAEIARRAQMYSNSARQAYELGHQRTMRDVGKQKVKWNLGATEQHCGDCLTWAGKGWMNLDDLTTVPGAGATACKSNCDCSLSYK